MMPRFVVVALLCYLISAAVSGLAQGTNVILSGSVLDPDGAVIPNAQVTALNVKTGVLTTVTTNDAGVYVFASLQPGLYQLKAEARNFRMYELNDVTLEVGARIDINFSLVLLANAEAVNVVEPLEPALLTGTASVGAVINDQRVTDLPLPDRDALGLVLTQPGLFGDNVGGSRTGAVNVTIDGVSVGDQSLDTGIRSLILPSIDMVEEVRLITSPVDAQLGRGSAQVQASLRSGTNEFHGSIFEFHSNSALNANNWFNNQQGIPRNGLVLNQFGGRLGGPIKQNRTFFYFLYETIRERSAAPVTALTYTDSARQGVFRFFPGVENANANGAIPTVDASGRPVRPAGATGDLQSVNLFGLDPNRLGFDSTGTIRRLLNLMPLPNDFRFGDGLNVAGHTWRRKASSDLTQYFGRIDHTVNRRNRLSLDLVNLDVDLLDNFMPRPFPNSPGGSGSVQGTYSSFRANSNLASTMSNEFFAGAQRVRYRFSAPWELPGGRAMLPTASGQPYLPVFRLVADPIPSDNDPQGRIAPFYTFGDTMQVFRGRHSWKFGGDVRLVSLNGFTAFNVMPRVLFGLGDGPDVVGVNSFQIPGLEANEGIAQDLLMDLSGSVGAVVQTFNASSGPNPTFLNGETRQRTWRQREFSFFIQDDFKFRPTITLNLGLRYEFYGVPWDANGRAAGLVGGSTGLFGVSGNSWSDMYRPGRYVGNYTQVQLIGPKSQNPNVNLYANDWNNFAPVIGMSWAIPYFGKDQTVLRAGYSMSYTRTGLRLTDIVAGDQPGLQTQTIFTSDSYLSLSQVSLPLVPEVEPLEIVPLTDRTQVVRAFDNNLRTPYVQNWNLTIQRQLPGKFTLDVRYVGSKGTKLLRTVNLNEVNIFENGILDAFLVTQRGGDAPLFDRLFSGFNLGLGTVNGRTITGSASLRAFSGTREALANNNVGEFANFLNTLTLFGQRGGLLRWAGLPENWIVVNPQFGGANFTGNFSNSSYHSLQLNADHRLASGFSLQSNYTWSRTLGDEEGDSENILNSYRNGRDRRIDKRLLAFHRTHVIRNSGTWELPFGPRNRFFSGSSGILAQLLNGWKVSGILNVFSGQPIGFYAPVSSFNQHLDNTPTQVGPLPKSAGEVKRVGDGVVYFDGLRQAPDPSIAGLTASQLLNTRSMLKAIADSSGRVIAVNPRPGTIGSYSQTYLEGPGSLRFDVNLTKTFSFKEGRELQLRADAINLLNTPQFGNPDVNINSNTFGRITTASGERIVVLNARISF